MTNKNNSEENQDDNIKKKSADKKKSDDKKKPVEKKKSTEKKKIAKKDDSKGKTPVTKKVKDSESIQEKIEKPKKGNPIPFDFSDMTIENNVPKYLSDTYSWAYVNDKAIEFWNTPFKVNFILWGNAKRLTQALNDKLETRKSQKILQVTAVYGDIMPETAKRMHPETTLDVIDIVTGQLRASKAKLDPIMGDRVGYYIADSSDLPFEDAKYDQVYVFMLLHEQPVEVRNKTVNEAFRVLKPGGDLIIVDYHQPYKYHPLLPIMWCIYKTLEPFAMNLWGMEIPDVLGEDAPIYSAKKETYFGSLFQRWVITKSEDGKAHWHSKNPLPKSDK